MKVSICIPTANAASMWPNFLAPLKAQAIDPEQILVIDSESTDGTPCLARREGFRVVEIARKDFRHGATRQYGVDLLPECDVVVFLTQDAILAGFDSIARLVSSFDNPEVGASYGRQLPRDNAGWLEAHARYFNYPAESAIKSLKSAEVVGFKSIFFSNSFGAYRRLALQSVGGFPLDANFGEDTIVAARLLLAGWSISYSADAKVYHSHGYSISEEYLRYVQIGILHGSNPWLQEKFGRVKGEGFRFMRSQLGLLLRKSPLEIPAACVRAFCKYVGYKKGLSEGQKAISQRNEWPMGS